MKRLLGLVLLLLLLESQVLAQDVIPPKPIIEDEDYSPETSEELRPIETWSIVAGKGRRSIPIENDFLAAIYYLKPHYHIVGTLSRMRGSYSDTLHLGDFYSSPSYTMETRVQGWAGSVGIRHFPGNSFFLQGGLQFEKVSAEAIFQYTESTVGKDLGFYRRLDVEFQIGNQWQWENWTLGFIWGTFLEPVSGSHTFKSPYVGNRPSGIISFRDAATGELLLRPNFFIGWSF